MPEQPPDECAQCGAAIPHRAAACPECGADERTGWRETSVYDGLDLPSDTDDKPAASAPRRALPWYWFAVAALLMALFLLAGLGLR